MGREADTEANADGDSGFILSNWETCLKVRSAKTGMYPLSREKLLQVSTRSAGIKVKVFYWVLFFILELGRLK